MRELELLHAVSGILDRSLSLEEVVLPVLTALAERLSLLHGTVTLVDRRTGEVAIDVAHGISEHQVRRGRCRLGEGVTGTVVQSDEPPSSAGPASRPFSSTGPGAAGAPTCPSSACLCEVDVAATTPALAVA